MYDERVGDVQRTAAIDLLTQAVEEGFLDLQEYEQRMLMVTSARMSSELVSQLQDLPAPLRWDPRRQALEQRRRLAMPMAGGTRQTLATMSLILGGLSIPAAICYGFGAALGAAAIVVAVPAARQPSGRLPAILGLLLGLVGVLLSVAFVLFYIATLRWK